MPLIDPRKLDALREMLDGDVAMLTFEGLTRTEARQSIAHSAFQLRLVSERSCGYWFAWAMKEDLYSRIQCDEADAGVLCTMGAILELTESGMWQASNREDAETAVLCTLIDPDSDLAMSDYDVRRVFGEDGPISRYLPFMNEIMGHLRCHSEGVDRRSDLPQDNGVSGQTQL